jgi:hypothetical protein
MKTQAAGERVIRNVTIHERLWRHPSRHAQEVQEMVEFLLTFPKAYTADTTAAREANPLDRYAHGATVLFGGLDDSPLEVWQVPEVRAFCKQLVDAGVFSHLSEESQLLVGGMGGQLLHGPHPGWVVQMSMGMDEPGQVKFRAIPTVGFTVPKRS